MKYIAILIISLFTTLTLLSQQSDSRTILIHLKDKGNTTALLAHPESFLSQKALERRYQQNIQINESDLPLNEAYIETIASHGAKILARSRWFNYIVAEVPEKSVSQIASFSWVAGIRQLDNSVKVVDASSSSKPFFRNESYAPHASATIKSSNSDLYNYGAAANQINMLKGEFLHNKGFTGQGMTIAVLDAGFNSVDIMPAFDSLRANNQIKGVYNFVDPTGNIYDPNISAHGTMVLSTMGAYIQGDMIGTAPKADYWLLRSEDAGSEYILEEYYWVQAAEFADSVGANIINSSLGYTTYDDPAYDHTYEDMDGNTTYITIGADKAAEKGILVVNSAGNSGANPWTYIGAPADGDSVFTIGAVDAFGNYAYFSSKGPTYDRRIKPTVVSQGQNSAIYGPWGLGFGNGTSFSSPIIAGISACLWQAEPSLTNMQIIDAMRFTASKSNNPDTLVGWGIPDLSAAYDVLGFADNNETRPGHQLQVSPNPFYDNFTITLNEQRSKDIRIELFSPLGKLVYSQNISSRSGQVQVDNLTHLSAGIYILRLSDKYSHFTSRLLKL